MGRGRHQRRVSKAKPGKLARKLVGCPKDMDQIQDEMKNPPALPIDEDLPGLGQFYCLACARFFISKQALVEHKATSRHKRRVKLALEPQYTVRESEAAAGMGSPV